MSKFIGEYPETWTKEFRNEFRAERGNKCERCSHPHDPANGYALTIHHLDNNKANCSAWNLAALCQRCHSNHPRSRRDAERLVIRALSLDGPACRGNEESTDGEIMSNTLSGEMLKMWFENKPYVAPAAWISYRDEDSRRIGPRDKLDQSKVKINPERLKKMIFGPWKEEIVLSPSSIDRAGIKSILIFDAPEGGNGLLWWEFENLDLKAGESATVWNPIG